MTRCNASFLFHQLYVYSLWLLLSSGRNIASEQIHQIPRVPSFLRLSLSPQLPTGLDHDLSLQNPHQSHSRNLQPDPHPSRNTKIFFCQQRHMTEISTIIQIHHNPQPPPRPLLRHRERGAQHPVLGSHLQKLRKARPEVQVNLI